jgi:hypothetical protein
MVMQANFAGSAGLVSKRSEFFARQLVPVCNFAGCAGSHYWEVLRKRSA